MPTVSIGSESREGVQPVQPAWLAPVFESLASRWGAEAGWDGDSARPTDSHLVAELLNCLFAVMPPLAKPPMTTPLADGGVQAEWHKGEMTLEIVVLSDESPRFYFFDPLGHEEEGRLEDSIEAIRRYIDLF